MLKHTYRLLKPYEKLKEYSIGYEFHQNSQEGITYLDESKNWMSLSRKETIDLVNEGYLLKTEVKRKSHE